MQRLLDFMIALALLVVPLGMVGGTAGAHSGMAASGCHEGQPEPAEKPQDFGMSAECALACAALPAVPVRIDAPAAPTALVHPVAASEGLADVGPESLDPPPRA